MTLGKLEIAEEREIIAVSILRSLIREIMILANCAEDISEVVSEHLVGSNLAGVESHGVMRVMQYVQQFESGYMCAAGRPALARKSNGAWFVDGKRGIGIPAMKMAVEQGCQIAKETGVSAVALTNCGHTGRLGAYAELGAQSDCLTIIIGGGNRKEWPMVAPFGGKKAILPTNPYAFGILAPLRNVLKQKGYDFLWYLSEKLYSEFPFTEEVHTSDINILKEYNSDAILVPGNEVPYFLRGLKVQVFHGLAGEKKGHFRIRHYFDLYLTQGPYFTNRFIELSKKHKISRERVRQIETRAFEKLQVVMKNWKELSSSEPGKL